MTRLLLTISFSLLLVSALFLEGARPVSAVPTTGGNLLGPFGTSDSSAPTPEALDLTPADDSVPVPVPMTASFMVASPIPAIPETDFTSGSLSPSPSSFTSSSPSIYTASSSSSSPSSNFPSSSYEYPGLGHPSPELAAILKSEGFGTGSLSPSSSMVYEGPSSDLLPLIQQSQQSQPQPQPQPQLQPQIQTQPLQPQQEQPNPATTLGSPAYATVRSQPPLVYNYQNSPPTSGQQQQQSQLSGGFQAQQQQQQQQIQPQIQSRSLAQYQQPQKRAAAPSKRSVSGMGTGGGASVGTGGGASVGSGGALGAPGDMSSSGGGDTDDDSGSLMCFPNPTTQGILRCSDGATYQSMRMKKRSSGFSANNNNNKKRMTMTMTMKKKHSRGFFSPSGFDGAGGFGAGLDFASSFGAGAGTGGGSDSWPLSSGSGLGWEGPFSPPSSLLGFGPSDESFGSLDMSESQWPSTSSEMNLPSSVGKYSGGGGGGMAGFDDGVWSKYANDDEPGMDDNDNDWRQYAEGGDGSDGMDGGSMVYGSMTKRQEGDGRGTDADFNGWSKYGSSTGNTAWKPPSSSSSSCYGSGSSYGSTTGYGGSVTKRTISRGGAGVRGESIGPLSGGTGGASSPGSSSHPNVIPVPITIDTLVYPDGEMTLMPPDSGAAAATSIGGNEGPGQ